MTTDIVLVHGGWMGAWCWKRVTPVLTAAGFRVAAPDLPGHGADPLPSAEANMALYVDRILDTLAQSPGPAHLVGHGLGGLVISQVAEMVPDRVVSLTYLAALLTPPGEPGPPVGQGSSLPGSRQFNADATMMFVPPADIPEIFFADCRPEDIAFAIDNMVPRSTDMSPAHPDQLVQNWPNIPRAYITCRDDRVLPLPLQYRMIGDVGCDHVVDMISSHAPFFSAPGALAQHIITLTRRMGRHVDTHPPKVRGVPRQADQQAGPGAGTAAGHGTGRSK